jgi:hypothetical protein
MGHCDIMAGRLVAGRSSYHNESLPISLDLHGHKCYSGFMSENKNVSSCPYPRLKGYSTYAEGLKARKKKYGESGAGPEPTFLCSCGKFHVDMKVVNSR